MTDSFTDISPSGSGGSGDAISIQGVAVSSTAPSDGYVLTYVTSSSNWEPKPLSGGSFTAGGDLSGTSFSQIVAKVKGTTITTAGGALPIGAVLRTTAVGTADWGAVNLADTDAVTGTLPVTNGGTGLTSLGAGVATFLNTPSSANLASAVSDETGTGELVFSTTPTFKTSVKINNPANTFAYTLTPGAISANRTLNIPVITATDTLVVTTLAQTLTNKTLTSPIISSISNTGTLTLPTSTDTLVGRATTDTLTNKTLTSPIISSISNTGILTLPTSTDTLVGRATTDTLTNKTLTSPIISSISNTGTLTLPTSTDTLVGRATTDTLTNKTLTSPVINTSLVLGSGGPTITTGTGVPASSPPDGSVYLRTDGTSSTGIYTRQSAAWSAVGGSGSFTAGGDLSGSESSQIVAKVKGTTITTAGGALAVGAVLRTTAVGTADWGAVNLADTDAVTGTLPVTNGGTGLTSLGAGVATFLGTPSSANLASAITDETGTGELVFSTTPTFKTSVKINNPANTFAYTLTPAAIAANRTLNLPLLTGTDTLVGEAFTQTLTNKTISGSSNTITNVAISTAVSGLGTGVATFLGTPSSANLASAITDETGSGALVFGTSPTISGPTISGSPSVTATAVTQTVGTLGMIYDDVTEITTTDATVTNAFTWTIVDEAVTLVDVVVTACRSTGATGAAYKQTAIFRRDGGTVTVSLAAQSNLQFEDVSGWNATIDNSTSTGRVRITGAASTTINWHVAIRRQVSRGT